MVGAGCTSGGNDEAMDRLSVEIESLSGRIAETEQRLDALAATTGELAGLPGRIDAITERVEELSQLHFEDHEELVEQLLRLRDHVTLQFGKMRMESEARKIEEMANDDVANLVSMLAEGGVDLDLDARRIEVGGSICLTEGILEFLAVGEGGKDHESLLYIDCVPSLLNAAFIALGLEPGSPSRIEEEGPNVAEGGPPYGPEDANLLYFPPTGPKVMLTLSWEEDGKAVTHRAEDLVVNRATGEPMPRVGWVFLGSRFATDDMRGGEVYVADITKDVISVWHSYKGNAILDNPLPAGMHDDVYVPNTPLLPERGTPVRLLFTVDADEK
jgi:hypothetical protein